MIPSIPFNAQLAYGTLIVLSITVIRTEEPPCLNTY